MEDARTAIRMLAIDVVTAEVAAALSRNQVPSILLKGPSIALWLYHEGAGRSYVDSDILVPPEGRQMAEQTLARLGFVSAYAGTTPDEQDPHGAPWRRSRDAVCIDLHRSIAGIPLSPAQAWQILARQTETMRVGGEAVQVLGKPARALNVALHAAHNGVGNRQSLKDLELALQLLPDRAWREVMTLAYELRAVPSFAAGLRLLPQGSALAGRLGLPISQSVRVRLHAMSAPPLALGYETLAEKQNLRAKLRYLGENVMPSPAFMRNWSSLAHCGPIGMGAAYVQRWVWLSTHAIPGYLAWRRVRRRANDRSVVAERAFATGSIDTPAEEQQGSW